MRLIGVVVAVLVSIGLGIAALTNQQNRGTALGLLAAAWVIGLLPIIAALLWHAHHPMHPARVPFVVAFAASLVAMSVPVVQSSCSERLGAGADLASCNFARADLTGQDLQKADLSSANLAGATLTNANLKGADLSGAKLGGIDAVSAQFTDANLSDAVLEDAALTRASFARADLTNAVFDDADLTDTTFAGAVLSGTSLQRTKLESAQFEDAEFDETRFDGASLVEAVFAGLDLDGVSLAGANLTQAILYGTTLRGAKLAGANLTGAELTRANLDGASLGDVILSNARLVDASLRNVKLDGATLAGADLTRAALDNASLRTVNLSDARLDGASLTGTVLSNVRLDAASLIGAKGFTDTALAAGVGVAPVNLGPYLTARDIRLESRDTILTAFGPVCRGARVAGAGRTGTFHPIVLLDGRGGRSSWTNEASNLNWEPMATRFGQLVGCVERTEITVQRCSYTEIGGLGRQGSITRYRNRLRLRVIDARAGSTVLDRTIEGSQPGTCPAVTSFQSNGRIEGSEITFSSVQPILANAVGQVRATT